MPLGLAKSICGNDVLLIEYEEKAFPHIYTNRIYSLTSLLITITSAKIPYCNLLINKRSSINLSYFCEFDLKYLSTEALKTAEDAAKLLAECANALAVDTNLVNEARKIKAPTNPQDLVYDVDNLIMATELNENAKNDLEVVINLAKKIEASAQKNNNKSLKVAANKFTDAAIIKNSAFKIINATNKFERKTITDCNIFDFLEKLDVVFSCCRLIRTSKDGDDTNREKFLNKLHSEIENFTAMIGRIQLNSNESFEMWLKENICPIERI